MGIVGKQVLLLWDVCVDPDADSLIFTGSPGGALRRSNPATG